MQNFQALGALPPDPQNSPPLRISGYAPAALCTVYNYMDFCSFCFEQFFLDRSVANLMMLTIDICLIVFCLKRFICITHCVTLIPSCYIALSYLFAKVKIADKFLMSLLNPPQGYLPPPTPTPPLKNLAYATAAKEHLP